MSLQGAPPPHPDHLSSSREEEEDGMRLLLSSPLGLYLQCPLSKAPGCFRTALVRSLELADANFIPTNWRGFSEHFGLRELRARSAEELVDKWADMHPYRREHTLRKVVEYATSKDHRKLLDSFAQTLRDHLLPEEVWTDDPASCFKPCHSCVPLTRTNSRSSEDVSTHYSQHTSPSHSDGPGHRRTHSLPKNIEINQGHPPHPLSPCSHGTGSNVTNIYMTCSCRNSPFTPSTLSPFAPSVNNWPHSLTSPTSTATATTISYSNTLAKSPVHTVTVASQDHSCTGTPRPTVGASLDLSQQVSPDVASSSVVSGTSEEMGQSEESYENPAGARRRHSSYSQEPVQPARRPHVVRQTHSSFNLHSDTDRTGGEPPPTPSHSHHHLSPGEISSTEGVNPNPQVIRGLGQEMATESEHPPTSTSSGSQEKKTERMDVMQEFGRKLFDTAPYNLVQRFYNSSTRELIILILATFFLYNGFRCVLQTMCEDGGFRKVFRRSESTLEECTRRFAMLSLRILTVVISPLCFCVHISPIASKPQIPQTTFSPESAVERMMSVHRSFSPHYEVSFIRAEPRRVFTMSETMTKRHINSIWMSIVYVVLFSVLLSYIGGVKLVGRRFTEGGVCQFMTASIVRLPFLNDDLHLLMVLDLILMLSVLLSIHMLKDYYYYENRIAIFAVTVGGEAERLYREIRQRWAILDWYCYSTAIAISLGTFALASVNKTIIPDPSTQLQPEHLLNWCFWISVLTVLPCLGLSSKRLVKKTSLPAFLLIAFLLRVVNLNIDAIPPESLDVFFLIGGSVMVFSLLLSLSSCHLYHYQLTQSRGSLWYFVLSLSLMVLLPVAVITAIYRETVHLAGFVQW